MVRAPSNCLRTRSNLRALRPTSSAPPRRPGWGSGTAGAASQRCRSLRSLQWRRHCKGRTVPKCSAACVKGPRCLGQPICLLTAVGWTAWRPNLLYDPLDGGVRRPLSVMHRAWKPSSSDDRSAASSCCTRGLWRSVIVYLCSDDCEHPSSQHSPATGSRQASCASAAREMSAS